jgi:hypothetical protein
MRIVKESDVVTISRIVEKPKGIVVHINSVNKKVSILVKKNHMAKEYGFAQIGLASEYSWHTVTQGDLSTILERYKSGGIPIDNLHWFGTMKEFAQEALNQGWRFYDEE